MADTQHLLDFGNTDAAWLDFLRSVGDERHRTRDAAINAIRRQREANPRRLRETRATI